MVSINTAVRRLSGLVSTPQNHSPSTSTSMVHTLLTAALSLLWLAALCSPQHQQQPPPDPMMIHVAASEREVLVGHLTSDQAETLFLTRRQRLAWTEEQYLR